ncbi:MAG: hypothetical protein E5V40_03335 [Mesorhizobium sp.]|nr:MAG: hypothetical protein E5V40_03335 [Mesorhizobium sp.]
MAQWGSRGIQPRNPRRRARSKERFGLMIDIARAEPVLIEKLGCGVVQIDSAEEYERLSVQSGRG